MQTGHLAKVDGGVGRDFELPPLAGQAVVKHKSYNLFRAILDSSLQMTAPGEEGEESSSPLFLRPRLHDGRVLQA